MTMLRAILNTVFDATLKKDMVKLERVPTSLTYSKLEKKSYKERPKGLAY